MSGTIFRFPWTTRLSLLRIERCWTRRLWIEVLWLSVGFGPRRFIERVHFRGKMLFPRMAR
jgi:hypothetical protein